MNSADNASVGGLSSAFFMGNFALFSPHFATFAAWYYNFLTQ